MSKIEWGFVFDAPDGPRKDECFFCGAVIIPYPLLIALDARCVDKEKKHVFSDAACPMCPDCILGAPRVVAASARKNADRVILRAAKIARKKHYDRTMTEESNMEHAPSYSRDLRILADALEKMPDFSKVPDFALAAYIARFKGESKGKPSKKSMSQTRKAA